MLATRTNLDAILSQLFQTEKKNVKTAIFKLIFINIIIESLMLHPFTFPRKQRWKISFHERKKKWRQK